MVFEKLLLLIALIGGLALLYIASKLILKSVILFRRGDATGALWRASAVCAAAGGVLAIAQEPKAMLALLMLVAAYPAIRFAQRVQNLLSSHPEQSPSCDLSNVIESYGPDGPMDGQIRFLGGSQGLGLYINGWRVDQDDWGTGGSRED
jgi:hypothetical protein